MSPSAHNHVFLGHHFHGGSGAYFWGGFYPYYGYGYGYPDYYYDYPGYYGYAPSYSSSSMGQTHSPSGPSYDELGRFWGKKLKQGTGTRDEFIAFLQSDLLKASDAGRALFEGGFLKTYGKDGVPILNRALNEARSASPVASSGERSPPPKSGAVIESPPTKAPPAPTSKN